MIDGYTVPKTLLLPCHNSFSNYIQNATNMYLLSYSLFLVLQASVIFFYPRYKLPLKVAVEFGTTSLSFLLTIFGQTNCNCI